MKSRKSLAWQKYALRTKKQALILLKRCNVITPVVKIKGNHLDITFKHPEPLEYVSLTIGGQNE